VSSTNQSLRLKRKVLLGYLSQLDTVIPAVLGATALLGKVFFGIKSGLLLFGGLTALLLAGGLFLTRMIVGNKKVEKAALEEIRKEVRLERERALDDLGERLMEDEDPRTEKLLQDLRVLMEVYREEQSWTKRMNAASSIEILVKVDDLFKACERSLENTLELWRTALRMTTEGAKEPILERRERIVADIGDSLEHLSRILGEIQGYGAVEENKNSEMARIRAEMEECLVVANRVEERMKSWEGPREVETSR
jgi:hypothetical protein